MQQRGRAMLHSFREEEELFAMPSKLGLHENISSYMNRDFVF